MDRDRPIRVAYVCADQGVPCFGRKGCSVHVQEMIRAFMSQGVQIDLFAARLGGVPPRGLETIPLHRLPSLEKGEVAARERVGMAANVALRAALEREGPFDLVYERYSLWSFAGMEHARVAGIPGVLEVNAPLIEEQVEHRGLVDRTSAEQVAVRAFAAAEALVAVSDEVAAYLDRYADARGRVHVVPNGVDPTRFRPGLTPALPAKPDLFTIGFVGTLKPWHGLETLVEAFARLHRDDPNVRLLIVGDGPRRAHLEQSLAERELFGSVCFTGMVDPAAVPAWVASMDVAVAPYPKLDHFYFSPLKVYEYMATGVPVVAGRIGQLAHVVEDGVNGLFYPPGDSAALAAALARLRDNPILRHSLGQAGRIAVLREHTWNHVANRVLEMATSAGSHHAVPPTH